MNYGWYLRIAADGNDITEIHEEPRRLLLNACVPERTLPES
jgi:hypothetical protein